VVASDLIKITVTDPNAVCDNVNNAAAKTLTADTTVQPTDYYTGNCKFQNCELKYKD